MQTASDNLTEAGDLAILLIDQIEWIDLVDDPDGPFTKNCTEHMRHPDRRDQLKRIIEQLVHKLQKNPFIVAQLNPETICIACELVCKAVKSLIAVESPSNDWVLNHRLAVKFESIPCPWMQDETRSTEQLIVPALAN
jgi:hypothetical protein